MTRMTRRQFTALGGASTIALNAGITFNAHAASPAAAKYSTPFDPAVHVNPELRGVVEMLNQYSKGSVSATTLPSARKMPSMFSPLPEPQWSERTIAGPKGAPDVRIYIVNASTPERPKPAILYIHGGGFVIGDAKAQMRSLQEQSIALDCVIVSVEYRLAPETSFAGSLEDNYAALKWLYGNATELGVDKAKIAVMGESAGGGHAAMLAIAARDRGEVPLIFQALVYPMLDDRTGSTRAVSPYVGKYIWNADSNRFGWSSLLGVPAGSSRVPKGAVPARVEDLSGLPATFIGVGSIDLFADEDIEYARRLVQAGVPTELNVIPGAFHGFQSIVPNASISKQFVAALNAALHRAFERTAVLGSVSDR